jgi:hypothetical protein
LVLLKPVRPWRWGRYVPPKSRLIFKGLHAVAWQKYYWRMLSSGMLRLVTLVRTDVSVKRSASIIRVTRIVELGTGGTTFLRKRRFVLKPHSVTSQKTAFFTVTAVKPWNLT